MPSTPIILLLILLAVIAIVLVRTLTFARPTQPVAPLHGPEIDPHKVAEHLAGAIQCQTISNEIGEHADDSIFYDLHRKLEEYYPLIHTHLKKETINGLSLLYTWQGSQPELKPLLFAAHQDVVPADSPEEWRCFPYEGLIADNCVWGRGALDIKNQLITIMEAVEHLLEQGYQPQRTIYLAFGHDEEVGGIYGARLIAGHLEEQGVELEAVIDEGSAVMYGMLPGVEGPVALIGNSEKGYLTLELKVETEAGHSSMPPQETAPGILGRALSRLDERRLPGHLSLLLPMVRAVGMAVPFLTRMQFANLWLFAPYLRRSVDAVPQTSAAIRTTTAPTFVSAGVKENILPKVATAKINFRLIPGDSLDDVLRMVRQRINDPRVRIIVPEWDGWQATPFSPIDSHCYHSLETLIRQLFNDPPVAPYMVFGATDARHYARICRNVYRFTPVTLKPEDLKRVHGRNECIRIDALTKMVQFFVHLVQRWDTA